MQCKFLHVITPYILVNRRLKTKVRTKSIEDSKAVVILWKKSLFSSSSASSYCSSASYPNAWNDLSWFKSKEAGTTFTYLWLFVCQFVVFTSNQFTQNENAEDHEEVLISKAAAIILKSSVFLLWSTVKNSVTFNSLINLSINVSIAWFFKIWFHIYIKDYVYSGAKKFY